MTTVTRGRIPIDKCLPRARAQTVRTMRITQTVRAAWAARNARIARTIRWETDRIRRVLVYDASDSREYTTRKMHEVREMHRMHEMYEMHELTVSRWISAVESRCEHCEGYAKSRIEWNTLSSDS